MPCMPILQACVQELGIDVRDAKAVDAVVGRHAADLDCVWNLAAPLYVAV